ncbi:MAG: Uncharacterised protein [Bacteroidota bacterium]|nr:MAG: Uncharacterised protein [Bacteroidota bacterium]
MKILLILIFFPFLSFSQLVTSVNDRVILLHADMTWEYYMGEPTENEPKQNKRKKSSKRKKTNIKNVIEEVPIFPGCETEKNKRLCFQDSMMEHISENFKYPILAQQNNIKGRVFIQFIVDRHGSIINIKTRGSSPHLQAEAYRLAKLLPKMTPAKQNGKPVAVPFSIPIVFNLN